MTKYILAGAVALMIILMILVYTGVIAYTRMNAKACGGFTGEVGVNKCAPNYSCIYSKYPKPDQQGRCVFFLDLLGQIQD